MATLEFISLDGISQISTPGTRANAAELAESSTRIFPDEYREIYPSLELTTEQAKNRAQKYRTIPRLKKPAGYSFQDLLDKVDLWKPVNKIVALNHDAGNTLIQPSSDRTAMPPPSRVPTSILARLREAVIYFKLNRWLTFHSILVFTLTFTLIIVPVLVLSYLLPAANWEILDSIIPLDEQWLAITPMFYGYYNSSLFKQAHMQYSISKAFFWVNTASRVVYFLFILIKLVMNISLTYASRSDADSQAQPGTILGIWDHKATTKRAVTFSRNVVRDFIKKVMDKSSSRHKMDIAIDVIINILSYIVIAVLAEMTVKMLAAEENILQLHSSKLQIWQTPAMISFYTILTTFILDLMQFVEKYKHEYIKVATTMARIAVLNISVLISILHHYTALIQCTHEQSHVNGTVQCTISGYKIWIDRKSLLFTINLFDVANQKFPVSCKSQWFTTGVAGCRLRYLIFLVINHNNKSKYKCWETWIGQKIFLMMLCYMIVSLIFYFVVDLFKILLKYSGLNIIQPRFIQRTIIGNLCFIDGLFWLGFYYSPVLPVLWLAYFVVSYFYHLGMISVACTYRNCSTKLVRFSKTLFLLLFTVSCSIGCGTLVYHSFRLSPSRKCGPFKDLDRNFSPEDMSGVRELSLLKMLFWLVDLATGHPGLWYSSIIALLTFFIRFAFRASALNELISRRYHDRRQIATDKRYLDEDFRPLKKKLVQKNMLYKPSMKNMEISEKTFAEFSVN